MPYLTVIIPTFRRSKCLNNCLDRLFSQGIDRSRFEVIVVDDGSEDETLNLLSKKKVLYENLKFFTQKNSGQGIARNTALKHAKGQIILFIGDDIYASKDFLKAHISFHQEHIEKNAVSLGRTEWCPESEINSYMKWLTNGGPQFDFNRLKNGEDTDFWHFYTSNVSIKKEIIEDFDPDFKSYGWEDTELAYRLHKKYDLKIIYNENALAHHDHYMQENSLNERMKAIGKSAIIFQKKHIELKLLPIGMKLYLLRFIGSSPVVLFLKIIAMIMPNFKKYYWFALSKRYFLLGSGQL